MFKTGSSIPSTNEAVLLYLTPHRAAQRAFRERKQSQLAELQARIQQYEQGEIERNVALQSVAKRLKEENDTLREENMTLKAKVAQLEQERDQKAKEADNKRGRDEIHGSDPADPVLILAVQVTVQRAAASLPARSQSGLVQMSLAWAEQVQGRPAIRAA